MAGRPRLAGGLPAALGDEIVVFAEFVEGGSLEARIRSGQLTRLDEILDVAIQCAWGLHATHECGLIHQDFKPGNVLLTSDGVAKVTDFGLARARGVSGGLASAAGQSILVSTGGRTEASCSPEQAAGQPLSRKTDVWSWGVSVLELFTGEVTWPSGTVALEVLEDNLASGGTARLPPMPAGVVDVLRHVSRRALLTGGRTWLRRRKHCSGFTASTFEVTIPGKCP